MSIYSSVFPITFNEFKFCFNGLKKLVLDIHKFKVFNELRFCAFCYLLFDSNTFQYLSLFCMFVKKQHNFSIVD